jgi:bacillopeptidase F (M6 metalloprotease family)
MPADVKKLKAIQAGMKKISDAHKAEKAASKSAGGECDDERDDWHDADTDAAEAMGVLILAMMADGASGGIATGAVLAAFTAFLSKMSKLRTAEQKLLRCLRSHNDSKAGEHDKRLKQLTDYESQVKREMDNAKR